MDHNPIGNKPWTKAEHAKAHARTTREVIGEKVLLIGGVQPVKLYGFVYGSEAMGFYAEVRMRVPPASKNSNVTNEVIVVNSEPRFDTEADATAWCHAHLSVKDLAPEPEFNLSEFCAVCYCSLGGKSPEGYGGFVDDRTMHIVGVETSKNAFALCGHKYVGKVEAIKAR